MVVVAVKLFVDDQRGALLLLLLLLVVPTVVDASTASGELGRGLDKLGGDKSLSAAGAENKTVCDVGFRGRLVVAERVRGVAISEDLGESSFKLKSVNSDTGARFNRS